MNGLALNAFLQGQRQADEDYRTKARFPIEQQRLQLINELAAMQNDRYAQETPLSVEGLGLRNTAQSLQNARYAQETPLSVTGLRLNNSAREMQNDRYAQETPLSVEGLGLRNTAQSSQNARYEQLTPLAIEQQRLGNEGNKQANAQREINLNTQGQLQPTKNALDLQNYTRQLSQNQLMQGIQSYRITGKTESLRQAINATFGGNVSITPSNDGKLHVKDDDGEHVFNSADEFIGVLTNMSSPKRESNWSSIGDGLVVDHATGQGRQIYKPEPKPNSLELPITDKALGEQANDYVSGLGLDLKSGDDSLLLMDVQAKAKALMQQGVQPSIAFKTAYDSVKGGISGDAGLFSDQSYNPQTTNATITPPAINTPINPSSTAIKRASQQAIDHLKANNTPAMREHFKNWYGYLPDGIQ